MKERINLIEVGPRDGLQNENCIINVETKVELIERLAECGFASIESGAFVSPKWVPQMSDTDNVMRRINRKENVSYPVLIPNIAGFERAHHNHPDTIAVFAAASEQFSQKNTNCSISESLERFKPVVDAAKAANIRVRGYISCVLGCPYEQDISPSRVAQVAVALHEMGCYEISLGDTIGVGTPRETKNLIRTIAREIPVAALAGHFHNTYGQALANIWAAIEEGVTVFDTSVSGLGGCPYAKGASGNIASEDVVYSLAQSGFETGIDLDLLIETSTWIANKLGRQPCSAITNVRLLS